MTSLDLSRAPSLHGPELWLPDAPELWRPSPEVLRAASGYRPGPVQHRRAASAAVFTPASLAPDFYLPPTLASLAKDTTGATPIAALDDPIARWADAGSLASHGTQSTAGYRPLSRSMSVAEVDFDGGDDVLGLASAALSTSGDATFFCRYKLDYTLGIQYLFCGRGAASYDAFIPIFTAGGYVLGLNFILGGALAGQSGAAVALAADTNWHNVVITRTLDGAPSAADPAEYACWLDGAAQTVVATGAMYVTPSSALGGIPGVGGYTSGRVRTVGRLSRAITSAERGNLLTWLAALP